MTARSVDRMKANGFKIWLLGSLLIAALGFWLGPGRWLMLPPGFVAKNVVMTECIWLSWLWVAVFVTAVIRYRRRALRLLAGAPFALLWLGILLFRQVCGPFFCGW